MQKSKSKVLTLLLTFITILSIVALSFSVFVTKGSAGSEPTITGVKFSTIGAGANELKIFCTVSPDTLKQGNYWEGSLKDVITQEELDAFTTKIKINGKTLKEWMDTGYIRYLPATSAGQLDIVFKNSGDFLTFEDELITFEKDCKLPGVAALTEDITYKFKFQSAAETTGEKVENTPTTITGVKFSTIGAGANELKIFCTVSPDTLKQGNYWEGSLKDVITQEELDAFTTKIKINGKTLKEWMDTGYIRYLPATSAGQLDIVFKNSGDFLTFEDELITFEKDCKLPGVAALTEDITYKFKFQSAAETTGEKVENTSSSTSSETSSATSSNTSSATSSNTSSATSSNTSSATSSTSSIITPPTNDEFDEGKITWTGVHYFEDTASGHYIIHLNVSPKTLVAGQKYYENGEVQSISEAQFNQFADYIFFNGYSFKDLIELDPEIFVTIQASAGRTDNVEFTLSPAALKKNNIPYYGTTQKAEKIDLRAGCLLPNKAELKANDAWNVTPGKPQGIKADPSYIAKEPVKYYPTEGGDTSSETSSETSSDTSSEETPEEPKADTFTVEGKLTDASGNVLGGVSMSVHGSTTQSLITEEDGTFLLMDFEAGEQTFLVIKSGTVSSQKFEVVRSNTATKAIISADGKVLTVPAKAKTVALNLVLNDENKLLLGSTSVLAWETGYVPPADTDNGSGDAEEDGPQTGVPFACGIVLLCVVAAAAVVVTKRKAFSE